MRAPVIKLIICFAALLLSGCNADEPIAVGNQAPDFTLTTVDGAKLKSSSFKGEIVVLNFWATWCEACRKEIPELAEFSATSRAKVIGISIDEGVEAAGIQKFAKEHGINYTVLIDGQELYTRYSDGIPRPIPYTFVIDPRQRIVNIYLGKVSKEALERDVRMIEERLARNGT